MADTYIQYQVLEKAGSFKAVSLSRSAPSAEEVLIRTKAIALNPLDWKQRAFGVMVQSWPKVLGLEGAGIIESVGGQVKSFKPGDEVMFLTGMAGSYQELVTIPAYLVAQKPATLSFEEAAAISLMYLTATAAIVKGLHLPFPSAADEGTYSLASILVLGGSSGVGASTIELLRLLLPSAVILATSSAKHHSRLISLGASQCFERDDMAGIKNAVGDVGVDAIVDTVSAAANQPTVFEFLGESRARLYAEIATGVKVEVPEGVNSTFISASAALGTEGVQRAVSNLYELVQTGKYRLPVNVKLAGVGFDAIPDALTRLQKGVSGEKLVVSL